MKTINTLEDALTMELQSLYCAEMKLLDRFSKLDAIIHSDRLRYILRRYTESCNTKKLKLSRALSYLHHQLQACSISVIDELIEESFKRIRFGQEPDVQEQMLINCIERINTYKICVYEAALRYAEELELEPVAEILIKVLEWERRTKRELVDLSVHMFATRDYTADV